MLNLSILLFIQFIFCMVFFFYFRKKIHETLKLKDYRREIDELIISFNRQAERHITYLETLLNNDLVKKNLQNYEQEKKLAPQAQVEPRPSQHELQAPVVPSTPAASPQTKPEIPLPPQLVKSYYAQFSSTTNGASINSNTLPTKSNHIERDSSNNTSNNHKTINPRRQLINNVLLLEQKGSSAQAIAKRLAISTGEVKLILKLNTSKSKSGNTL